MTKLANEALVAEAEAFIRKMRSMRMKHHRQLGSTIDTEMLESYRKILRRGSE